MNDSIPTLKEAQGKLVLFRRFAASTLPKGIAASDWPDNTTFSITNSAILNVQDGYKVDDRKQKLGAIQDMLREAFAGSKNVLYLNFTSGYRDATVPDMKYVSDFINPAVERHFSSAPSGRFGIMVMDFVTAKRCEVIIRTNH